MSIRTRMLAAAQRGLYPVVRLLLSFGVTETEFAKIARSVFVKVAAEIIEDSPIAIGNKATAQRIAVMTGVPRHAIKPILDSKTVIAQDEWYRNLCDTVLTEWHNDIRYVDQRGNPLPIPFSGEVPSFEALVQGEGKKGRADMSPHAVLDELKLVGAVEERPVDEKDPDGDVLLVAKEQYFRRVGSKIEDLEAAMDELNNMMSTKLEVMHNDSPAVYSADISVDDSDDEYTAVTLNALRRQAKQFVKSAKTTVTSHQVEPGDESKGKRRLGVGVYIYADDPMKESRFFSTTLDEDEDQQIVNE